MALGAWEGAGLGIRFAIGEFGDLSLTLPLKHLVTDRQNLIQDQDVRVYVDRDGKRQTSDHPAGIGSDRFVDELFKTGELHNRIEFTDHIHRPCVDLRIRDGVKAGQVVELARKSFPFVVVDLEDFFHREQLRVLQLSDLVFIILRLDFSALRNTRRALEYLAQAGIDRDRIRLVASQHGRSRELSPGQVEEALKMIISLGVVVPDWHPLHPEAKVAAPKLTP